MYRFIALSNLSLFDLNFHFGFSRLSQSHLDDSEVFGLFNAPWLTLHDRFIRSSSINYYNPYNFLWLAGRVCVWARYSLRTLSCSPQHFFLSSSEQSHDAFKSVCNYPPFSTCKQIKSYWFSHLPHPQIRLIVAALLSNHLAKYK